MRWTLPNVLTLARICLTPVIALLPFIQGYWPKVIAFLIFLAAGASDVVDGYLARRRNQVSELGQLLDPIADKLLLFATLIPIFWLTRHPTILVDYRIPWWGSLPVWVALLLVRSEEHTSELQSPCNLVCRLLLEKKKNAPYARSSCARW